MTIRVALTGIGSENARRTIHSAAVGAYDAHVSSGLAGGLRADCQAGDVLAARLVGEVEGPRDIRCDPGLLDVAHRCGAKLVDRFLTSKSLILHSRDKRRLREFGDAVDMETVELLACASGKGIPSIGIRAVSDTLDEDMPLDFGKTVGNQGDIRIPLVLGQLARRPQALPGLLRFAQQSRRAARMLAQFLDRFVVTLAHQPSFAPLEKAATI